IPAALSMSPSSVLTLRVAAAIASEPGWVATEATPSCAGAPAGRGRGNGMRSAAAATVATGSFATASANSPSRTTIGTVLTFDGPDAPSVTGLDSADARANEAGWACTSGCTCPWAGCAGTEAVASETAVALAGMITSSATLATTPNEKAPATQPSETRQIRVSFIGNPTLPLGIQCGIKVNSSLPGSDIITAIWWQHAVRSTTHLPPHPPDDGMPRRRLVP